MPPRAHASIARDERDRSMSEDSRAAVTMTGERATWVAAWTLPGTRWAVHQTVAAGREP